MAFYTRLYSRNYAKITPKRRIRRKAPRSQNPVPHPEKRNHDEQDRVQPGWNGYRQRKKKHRSAREQENDGEKNAAHPSRRPQRQIVVVPMQVERQKIPADDAAQVDEQKWDQPNAQLDVRAKKVETEHIEDQVEPVAPGWQQRHN